MYDFSKIPLIQLVDLMEQASKENNQEMINALALETAKRIYVPNDRVSKEEFLAEFGYKEIPKEKGKRK